MFVGHNINTLFNGVIYLNATIRCDDIENNNFKPS